MPIEALIKKVSKDLKKKSSPGSARKRLIKAGIIDSDGNLIRYEHLPHAELGL